MLVLQDMLNLPMTDILYSTAKNSSAGQRGQKDRQMNRSVVPNPGVRGEPKEIQNFLHDPQWQKAHHWALELHRIINAKLDAAIERIGKVEFARRLQEFRALMNKIKERCTDTSPLCYWYVV